jgi:hypothetical protein
VARCEHCGLRRHRTETFIVVHADSGEARQVGSGCLRDFLGGHDPDRACRYAEYLALARTTIADAERAAAPARPVPSRGPEPSSPPELEPFAAYAAQAVRRDGWVSREQARSSGRTATADAALRALEHGQPLDPADRALADGALRWARTLLAGTPRPTRFERAAAAVASRAGTLDHRDRGLVAALVGVYRRQRARSRHVGRPGGWLELAVLVERVTEQPSARHGVVRRCELLDADGNRLAWWQTQGPPLQAGEIVALRARVQRHTHFGTTAITVLSHCRRTPASPIATESFDARAVVRP